MPPLPFRSITNLVLFLLLLFAVPPSSSLQSTIGRRDLLEKNNLQQHSDGAVIKKTGVSTIPQTKNKTNLIKPKSITNSTKEKTLLMKPNSTSILTKSTSKPANPTKNQEKTLLKKLNSTAILTKSTSKPANSTSKSLNTTKTSPKSTKLVSKTTKPTPILSQKSSDPVEKKKPTEPLRGLTFGDEDEDDPVWELRDVASRFQETLIPDLEVISKTSKAYLNKANKDISQRFNPIVGKKYAPMLASFAFILIPFLLVSLIFNRIKAYFSLQKLIVFIQIYLSIYFSILSLSSLVTGLEPLRFFYATSQSTYVCLQLLQTLAYVLYLLLLLMYLVLVFSTESGIVSKLLGLGQTFVGLAVGLHYYVTVFHRAVLRQPPKTSWKVHAVYATCFLLVCLLGTAERRKKAYVVDGNEEEGKKN